MKLKVLYFGLVAEAINCTQEEFVLDTKMTIAQLQEILILKYNVLKGLSYQIALNKQLTNSETLITEGSEVAVLPPFAGG